MVHLTSNGSTACRGNGDWPSVSVTITNWDESRTGDKCILNTPGLSDHQQEHTISEEQGEGRSQSENKSRFKLSVVDCHHLQVPGRPHHGRLKSAEKELDPAEVELVPLPSHQLLDAGALLQSSCAKELADQQVPFHPILHPAHHLRSSVPMTNKSNLNFLRWACQIVPKEHCSALGHELNMLDSDFGILIWWLNIRQMLS